MTLMKINFNFPFSYNKPTIFIRNQDVRAKSTSYGNCENLFSYAITTYLFCKYHVKSTCGDKIISRNIFYMRVKSSGLFQKISCT